MVTYGHSRNPKILFFVHCIFLCTYSLESITYYSDRPILLRTFTCHFLLEVNSHIANPIIKYNKYTTYNINKILNYNTIRKYKYLHLYFAIN
jgi:hypothetical protein